MAYTRGTHDERAPKMNMGNQPRRLEVLDLVRGAGFLVVLLTHCLGFLGNTVAGRFVPQDATILDFFFLMSGFFAGYAYEAKLRAGRKSTAQAIAERVVRLRPFVVLGTILGLISTLVWSKGQVAMPSLIAIALKSMMLMPANGTSLKLPDIFPLDAPLWFLLYDWLAFLLFLFVLRHLSLKWLLGVAAITVPGLWCAAISRNTLSFGTLWVDCGWAVPRCLAGFTIGYILFRLYRPNRLLLEPRFGVLPVLALLTAVFLPVPADWPYSGTLQAFVATVIMPTIILFAAYVQTHAKLAPLARLAGKLSMPIYVLHYPIVQALSLLRWHFHLHGAAGIALLLLEFTLPIMVAFLVATYLVPFFALSLSPPPKALSSLKDALA